MEGFIPSSVNKLIERGGSISLISSSSSNLYGYWEKLLDQYPLLENHLHSKKLIYRIKTCNDGQESSVNEVFSKRFFHTPVEHLKHKKDSVDNSLDAEIDSIQSRDQEFLLTRISKPISDNLDIIDVGCVNNLDEQQMSCFLYNIGVAREFYQIVFVILEGQIKPWYDLVLKSTSVNTVWLNENYSFDNCEAHFINTLNKWGEFPLVIWSNLPFDYSIIDKNLYRRCIKPYVDKKEKYFQYDPSDFDQLNGVNEKLNENLVVSVLKKNPPRNIIGALRKFRWFIAVVLFLMILLIPESLQKDVFVSIDWSEEINTLKYNAYVEHRFDGKTTLQRPAKRAIHLYSATVPTLNQLDQYMKETLEKNGLKGRKLLEKYQKNQAIYPADKYSLRFYPPDDIINNDYDSLILAYDYYASIVTDTIAYITDHFNDEAMGEDRVHKGVDLAARMGSFILAPFSGKAYVSQTKWGGNTIVLVNDYNLMFFAHCENVFYLSGQDVIKGDPMASVGMTGRTTGPHAHIGTGYLNTQGKNYLAGLRFDLVDPFVWYFNGADAYVSEYGAWIHKSYKHYNSTQPDKIGGLSPVKAKSYDSLSLPHIDPVKLKYNSSAIIDAPSTSTEVAPKSSKKRKKSASASKIKRALETK